MAEQNEMRTSFTKKLPLNDVDIESPKLPLRILVEHEVSVQRKK